MLVRYLSTDSNVIVLAEQTCVPQPWDGVKINRTSYRVLGQPVWIVDNDPVSGRVYVDVTVSKI